MGNPFPNIGRTHEQAGKAPGAGVRRAAGAPSLPNPPVFANLTHWFDFSDLSVLWQDTAGTIPVASPGDPIRRIDNKGSDVNALLEDTFVVGGRRTPTWAGPDLNGLGVGDFSSVAGLSGPSDFIRSPAGNSFAVVFKPLNAFVATQVIASQQDSVEDVRILAPAQGAIITPSGGPTPTGVNPVTAGQYTWIYWGALSGAQLHKQLTGVQLSNTAGYSQPSALTDFNIGSRNSSGSDPADSFIAAVYHWSIALTAPDWVAVEAYFASEYGL